jgi:CheY-like chemotaxis protein
MEPHEEAAAEQRQMLRKHVFVINGAAEFLDIVRQLLEQEQYNVTTTNFMPQSFDQIVALEPDLIIIDLVFGRTAGWELLERLHTEAVTRDIPVVLTSTDPRILERARQQVERIGPHRSVAKPLDIDELLAAVDSLVGAA